VLPFRVAGDQASLDYVAQGIAGGLSASLFQLRGLHVASATAIEQADTKGPLERTARELGANLLIKGTLEGTAERMRLQVILEDVADGRRMWTGDFSGQPRDVIDLENQIYFKVSAALGLEASNTEHTAVRSAENSEAYDLFLKGNDAMRHRESLKSVEAAVRFQQEALNKDPGFALAYSGLADASLEMYRQKKDSFWAEKAMVAAQQAVRLDDNRPEAHFSLGNVYEATGKTSDAIAEEKRGLELAPESDQGYRHLAHALLDLGRKDEALQDYQAAIRIDPYYWSNYNALGYAYFQLGEFDEALNAFRRVVEIEPDYAYGYDNVGAVYIRQGKWSKSIPLFEKALELQPDVTAYSNLGTAYFHLRRYNAAARMFEKAVEMSPNDQVVLGNLADAYRWSQQPQKAIATYNKAIAAAYHELQVNHLDAGTMQSLALYYAKIGSQTQALEFIRRARSLDSSNVQFMYSEAEVRSLAGQTNGALKALRQAFEKGYPPEEANVDPELDRLRNDPEFERLIETAKGSVN
jgi:tetratricopeptide (TPR) repeat protein